MIEAHKHGDAGRTLDDAEVARFGALANRWWDEAGEFKALHRLGPERTRYLRDTICRHFGRDSLAPKPLAGLTIVDIGCGGGLVTEPLARLGGQLTGIDPAPENADAAAAHAALGGLDIAYRAARAEDLVAESAQFDAVLALEVIEHIPDWAAFIGVMARLARPGGIVIVSTLNRTLKSYALAIVGAEYVLGWVPRGTHDWQRFVTPNELRSAFVRAGLVPQAARGLVFQPLSDRWQLSSDTDVNYFLSAAKPTAQRPS